MMVNNACAASSRPGQTLTRLMVGIMFLRALGFATDPLIMVEQGVVDRLRGSDG